MSHTQSKMIFLISSCIWEALWLCSTRSEPAPCAQSKAACLPLHHMLFPQNLGTGSKPTSTHFSLLYNYRPSDSAKKLSKFFLLCSRTLPWSGSGCPYPPSSIALPNKWAIFFFFCRGTLSFLLQIWVLFQVTVVFFLNSFFSLPLQDHFSWTSTALLLAVCLCLLLGLATHSALCLWFLFSLRPPTGLALGELVAPGKCLYYESPSS